ncbi:MAG: ABC-2 family transporter protein [Bacilli bacterium]|nr:ABC-2 family transporter protein [Bacilli bacterium]
MKLCIKTKLEYKASVIINSISQFLVFFTYYFMVVALFDKFNNIKGFNLYEIFICFGVIHFGYAFCETFFRGIDRFEDHIIKGSLDRFLVRPKNILLQILVSEVDFVKVFKALQALIIIVIGIVKLNINLDILKIVTLANMLISSVLIFLGIFIFTASYCFITVDGLEVKNLFTDGGKYLAEYPISIYKKGVFIFFTFVIPYGFINYYPLLYLIGRTNNILYAISPLVTILFTGLSVVVFYKGLKRYTSTGS